MALDRKLSAAAIAQRRDRRAARRRYTRRRRRRGSIARRVRGTTLVRGGATLMRSPKPSNYPWPKRTGRTGSEKRKQRSKR